MERTHLRHIAKPSLQARGDLWRMSYCGKSVRITKCISLSMYMKGFFDKAQHKKRGIKQKFCPCNKCLENLDGIDMLQNVP